MNLLRKFTALLLRSESKTQRQERILTQLDSRIRECQKSVQALDAQRKAATGLLHSLRPQGQGLNRAMLYAVQRKQSALRRRIANIDLEKVQQLTDLKSCEEDRQKAQVQRLRLIHQSDKYKHLQMLERKAHRQMADRMEETEIEEIIAWNK
ncbi:hypothetical protein PL78_18135 [Yersinia entomophaga]|uniref:Flagellar FliJ protein n=1 Tax=Yersinia entomophaga TaxID=935293 RepID=A0ABN4PXJ6_YERET|nr:MULTISPECIES: hypothetical protein [Yersinia]ANI31727.1 hypothetical protein PL78_18135 [Yersinia entomophaga]